MNAVTATVVVGLILGAVAGYRVSRILIVKVGGHHAGKPLVRGLAVAGGVLVLGPAVMFMLLAARGGLGWAIAPGEWGMQLAMALAVASIVATCVIAGAFAGMLSGRLIEDMRSGR